jgi:hypothetical protein
MCDCEYVEGIEQEDVMLFAGAFGGYVATAKLDDMLRFNADGSEKDPMFFKENPNNEMFLRNGVYVGAGFSLSYFYGNEPLAKGAGVGAAVYGAKNILNALMEPKEVAGYHRSNHSIDGHRSNHSIDGVSRRDAVTNQIMQARMREQAAPQKQEQELYMEG